MWDCGHDIKLQVHIIVWRTNNCKRLGTTIFLTQYYTERPLIGQRKCDLLLEFLFTLPL